MLINGVTERYLKSRNFPAIYKMMMMVLTTTRVVVEVVVITAGTPMKVQI
jgi:hypothetical protein